MFILILRKKETFDHIVWSLCIMNSSPRLKNMSCRGPRIELGGRGLRGSAPKSVLDPQVGCFLSVKFVWDRLVIQEDVVYMGQSVYYRR